MDKLRQAFNEICIKDLAKSLNTSPNYLYHIKYGVRKVSAKRALRIHKATNGTVSKYILRPDIWES